MEARQTLRGSAVPKGLMVVAAISAAMGLAVAGSIAVKQLAGSGATVNTPVHAAPGTVLRQDNPVQAKPALIDRAAEAQSGAPARGHVGRSTGSQSLEGSQALQGADAQGSAAAQQGTDASLGGWDARPGFRD